VKGGDRVKKQYKTHIAFNTHLFLPLFLLICFLSFSIFSAVVDHDIELAIGFALFIPFCLFAILISPLYIVFSDEEVKIIYTLGQKEIIKWKNLFKKLCSAIDKVLNKEPEVNLEDYEVVADNINDINDLSTQAKNLCEKILKFIENSNTN